MSWVFLLVRRSLGLALNCWWAKHMPGRCRDPVQPPNQPHPTAAEATDEVIEEAHAFYHHTQPLAMGGRPVVGASCLGFSC